MQVQLSDDAVMPTKGHPSDTCWDLTLIKKIEGIKGAVVPMKDRLAQLYPDVKVTLEYYSTGVSVCPPEGYYTELHMRSSCPKQGYFLANNVGIIDEHYTGELIACMVKMHPNVQDLQLPFRGVQLALRKKETCDLIQVDKLDETTRGAGGFGSTGQ